MRKICLILGLLVSGFICSAEQYVESGVYLYSVTERIAEACKQLISQGYHIDVVTIDSKKGSYLIIYSDKE